MNDAGQMQNGAMSNIFLYLLDQISSNENRLKDQSKPNHEHKK